MNTTELLNILTSDQVIKQYFVGVFPVDYIPKCNRKPAAFVINLDKRDEPAHIG